MYFITSSFISSSFGHFGPRSFDYLLLVADERADLVRHHQKHGRVVYALKCLFVGYVQLVHHRRHDPGYGVVAYGFRDGTAPCLVDLDRIEQVFPRHYFCYSAGGVGYFLIGGISLGVP